MNDTKHILLLGAGKSATVLISYLLHQSEPYNWKLVVADANLLLAQSKLKGHPNGTALALDVNDAATRSLAIQSAAIVISMLPPALHYLVARDCVTFGKNLLTASYLDERLKGLEPEINNKGLLFLCEMGLDPGIDHMSAMQLIQQIKNEGGAVRDFRSHCGGLVAPESDDNPWHYKITWNPANVVDAGKAGAVYKWKDRVVEKRYDEVFGNNQTVRIAGLGDYAYYPNRNSLPYAEMYELTGAPTFIRTTLRHPDFCKGWHYLVAAGLTDSTTLSAARRPGHITDWFLRSIQQQYGLPSFSDYLDWVVKKADRKLVKDQMEYLGLNSQEPLPEAAATSADVLRYLLETRLKMQQQDKDMIIMQHEIGYEKNKVLYSIKSCMIVKGDDALHTAMAKTVGLPLGIAAELILEKKISVTGLQIPVMKEIYEPVLMKLKEKGIKFDEL